MTWFESGVTSSSRLCVVCVPCVVLCRLPTAAAAAAADQPFDRFITKQQMDGGGSGRKRCCPHGSLTCPLSPQTPAATGWDFRMRDASWDRGRIGLEGRTLEGTSVG